MPGAQTIIFLAKKLILECKFLCSMSNRLKCHNDDDKNNDITSFKLQVIS